MKELNFLTKISLVSKFYSKQVSTTKKLNQISKSLTPERWQPVLQTKHDLPATEEIYTVVSCSEVTVYLIQCSLEKAGGFLISLYKKEQLLLIISDLFLHYPHEDSELRYS